MLEPHGSPMKWPGTAAEEEAGDAGLQSARPSQPRTQDDAAVHYVFQREHQEGELPSLAPKQRWVVGDDSINEVGCKHLYYVYICIIVYKQKCCYYILYNAEKHNLKLDSI